MSAALKTPEISDEALSFIRGGTPKTAKPELSTEPEKVRGTDTEIPARQQRVITAAASPSLVALSTRVASHLHESLMRASFERKLSRQEPHTHQDIITEALTSWLKKNGHPTTQS